LPVPLPFVPGRGAAETYLRVREQARVQLEGRIQQAPVHELLPIEQDQGLARLPAPSPGDMFLDLEGDPFARDGGREYLFGVLIVAADGSSTYRSHWAFSDAEERIAFEMVVNDILRTWRSNPGMHVYHYAPYEPGAFKRLMGRHATREAEVDRMLRAGRFVDLHTIVRQSLRASVEEYSIKKLEALTGYPRVQPLPEAGASLRVLQRGLELGRPLELDPDHASVVEAYNRDDCLSARALRDWLEGLRARALPSGPQPPPP